MNDRTCAYHYYCERMIESFGCWEGILVSVDEADLTEWLVRTDDGVLSITRYNDDGDVDAEWIEADEVANYIAEMERRKSC